MMLRLQNIQGGYAANNAVLCGIDLSVREGEVVGIIGLNGSGKSTLIKAIMNMLPQRSGVLALKGEDITSFKTHNLSQKGIALFMQGGTVFDELTIWENLLLASNNKIVEIELIQEYFIFLNADRQKLKQWRADRLSGGERHQLALAMCLLKKPCLLILDEPSAGLSPVVAKGLYETLSTLQKEQKFTILLIEQNIALANDFCDRVCLLERGTIQKEFKGKNIGEIERALFHI